MSVEKTALVARFLSPAWLDDLATAADGIRTASPAWHETLHSFVTDHRPSGGRTPRPGERGS